ncbi:MAG: beta-galactosidase [Bacteroidales bacterium]|nr:beta-galactosidase [Bacteroidales bacterium]
MKRILLTLSALMVTMMAIAGNWAPAGNLIKTRWAFQVDPKSPLPEYPRPQMVRDDWQNLNGLWNYAILPKTDSYNKADGEILVPFCVESSLSGVQKRVGKDHALWYERTFKVPAKWRKDKLLLHFGAVDWSAEVWVNGIKVGSHTGGYTPFSMDITSALRKSGRQTLQVKVTDDTDNGYQPRGKQVEAPHGIWYTPVTGIWQTVWLEPVPAKAAITSYYPVWNAEKKELNVDVEADGDYDAVSVRLLDGQTVVGEGQVIAVVNPKLWSPDSPYLYNLDIALLKKGKVVDQVKGYTALRTIVKSSEKITKDRRYATHNHMRLNGEPLFHFGPLDQGWWPDGLYTAPTDEALKYDIVKTKEWGWNMIRKHIKVEPARWYYWCDKLGVMVWQDMPCSGDHGNRGDFDTRDAEVRKNTHNIWSSDSFLGGTDCIIPQEWQDNYYKEWGEIIDAFKGFQCIVVWVPFNEAWGQFDTPRAVRFTREKDPTRLINESSGGNYALCGDIQDVHHYACPSMRAVERDMINVIGEYGGLGWPIQGHLWQADKNWGYGNVFDNGADLLALYAGFADVLKDFIRLMGCSGAVYTQTTDVEIEVNGIMTYDRAIIKVDEKRFAEINRSVINAMK